MRERLIIKTKKSISKLKIRKAHIARGGREKRPASDGFGVRHAIRVIFRHRKKSPILAPVAVRPVGGGIGVVSSRLHSSPNPDSRTFPLYFPAHALLPTILHTHSHREHGKPSLYIFFLHRQIPKMYIQASHTSHHF